METQSMVWRISTWVKSVSDTLESCETRSGLQAKETKLERADFLAGGSEPSWSGRAQPVLA